MGKSSASASAAAAAAAATLLERAIYRLSSTPSFCPSFSGQTREKEKEIARLPFLGTSFSPSSPIKTHPGEERMSERGRKRERAENLTEQKMQFHYSAWGNLLSLSASSASSSSESARRATSLLCLHSSFAGICLCV